MVKVVNANLTDGTCAKLHVFGISLKRRAPSQTLKNKETWRNEQYPKKVWSSVRARRGHAGAAAWQCGWSVVAQELGHAKAYCKHGVAANMLDWQFEV